MARVWKKKTVSRPQELTLGKTVNDIIPTIALGNARAWMHPMAMSPVIQAWVVHQPNFSNEAHWFFMAMNELGEDAELAQYGLQRFVPNANIETRVALLGTSVNEVPTLSSLPPVTTLFIGQMYSARDPALAVLRESVFSVLQGALNPIDTDKDMWVLRFGTISGSSYPMAFKPILSH